MLNYLFIAVLKLVQKCESDVLKKRSEKIHINYITPHNSNSDINNNDDDDDDDDDVYPGSPQWGPANNNIK